MDKDKDVLELLDAIIWGRRIVEVDNGAGENTTFVLRPLTLEERNMGNYVYQQASKKAKRAGVLTRDELTKEAIKHGLWKKSYEAEAKILREESEKLEKELKLETQANKKRRSPTTKLKRLRERSKYILDVLHKIETDHAQYIDLPSVENQAECERGNYFLRCATLSFPEMEPVWSSLEQLEKETDTRLVAALLRAYYNGSIADEAEIRLVARSGFWRCKWMGSKKNRGVKTLFGREMYDLTVDQFSLVYWSQVYDSAYESLETPSDEVIDNDQLFDRWLDEQNQKRKQERKKSAFDKKVGHLTSDAQEVGFNTQGEFCEECTCGIKEQAEARGYDKRGHLHDPSCSYGVYLYYNKDKKKERVEEIQSANPERVRRVLAHEQKRLADMGVDGVEEQYLRGDKTRTELGLGTTIYGPGEYGKVNKGRARPS
jgi:hypothetical protein